MKKIYLKLVIAGRGHCNHSSAGHCRRSRRRYHKGRRGRRKVYHDRGRTGEIQGGVIAALEADGYDENGDPIGVRKGWRV